MFSFSLLTLFSAFFLAPTLVVLRKSTAGVELPDDPKAKVKVYSTAKMDLWNRKHSNWTWTLDGNNDFRIVTGYDRVGWFGAYVNNSMQHRTLNVKIRSGLMHCGRSQTYFVNVTDASQNVIEQFNFKINTRGPLIDNWRLLNGTRLKSSYVWGRGWRTLSGDIRREKKGPEVAHIHCGNDALNCSIYTNDEIPIDYLIALHTSGNVREAFCNF
ncbi:hypothetical protein O181_033774 [Austropuccinia psidii MF-1]|uniref:Uncharacterized protein n=1 Tax=Austropuccinia psidii MF-1 TaxID=1389203 RepID=A0A9Q3CZR0_9BASI|nr:hypothetical protein [Austropuccinia psidii MF-1]